MDDYDELEKDARVHELLQKLDPVGRGWFIRDHWEGDLMAVGVSSPTNPDRLVYVAINHTFPERYDYECESAGAANDYETIDRGTQVEFNKLVGIMEKHLDVER